MILASILIISAFWLLYHVKFIFTRIPLLKDIEAKHSEEKELVSIIVPARNEENNIIPCLESLVGLEYGNKEIIVVNDRSEDMTEELVRNFMKEHSEVKLVNGRELEPGWIGKTFALSQGLREARGNLVLFTDADTRHSPENLSLAVRKLESGNTAVVSVLPFLMAIGFWEKVIQPFVAEMFLVSMPFDKVNDLHSRVVLCNGQFFLTYRKIIEEVGGLESIKENILDDIALARKIKDRGHGIYLCYGEKLFTVRMYTKLGEIINGWSKNFYRGFTLNYPGIMVIPAVIILLFFYVLPVFLPIIAILLHAPYTFTLFSFLPLSIEVVSTFFKRRKYGMYPETAWTIPLGALLYSYIMINSTLRTVLGIGVKWKGRSYYRKDNKT